MGHMSCKVDANTDPVFFWDADSHGGEAQAPHCEGAHLCQLSPWLSEWQHLPPLGWGLSPHFAEDFPAHKSALLSAQEGNQAS